MQKILAIVASAFLASAANAVIVVNGSFELGTNPGSTFVTPSVGDSTTITGWTVSGNPGGTIDYIGGLWAASNGSRSLDLTGNTGIGNGVSQTVALVAGDSYKLTFDQAANFGGGLGTYTVEVLLNNVSAGSFNFVVNGNETLANLGWINQSLVFTAPTAATTLTFRSVAPNLPFWGPTLDNVAIAANGAVPEPATWLMLVAGFGLVGVAARRRAAIAAAA
jgi:choice-of-anchor C domain-containing protein